MAYRPVWRTLIGFSKWSTAFLLCWACSGRVSDDETRDRRGNASAGAAPAVGGQSESVAGATATAGTGGDAGAGGAGEIGSSAAGIGGSAGGDSGGSDDLRPESCSISDSECGGDLIGAWRTASTCSRYLWGAGLLANCSELTLTDVFDGSDDVLTFESDLSYQETGSSAPFSETEVFMAPKSCMSDGTCASLDFANSSSATFRVAENGGMCTAAAIVDFGAEFRSDSGTYSVSGNTLIFNGKTDNPVSFCVTGNALVTKSYVQGHAHYFTFTRM